MKAEEIAKLSDDDIARHFSGAFGSHKLHDALALIRFLASKHTNAPPRPFQAA